MLTILEFFTISLGSRFFTEQYKAANQALL